MATTGRHAWNKACLGQPFGIVPTASKEAHHEMLNSCDKCGVVVRVEQQRSPSGILSRCHAPLRGPMGCPLLFVVPEKTIPEILERQVTKREAYDHDPNF